MLLAWQRDTATFPLLRHLFPNSWNRDHQGIWMTEAVLRPNTGRWTFKRPRHRTNSAYDVLDSLVVDSSARDHIGYHRR